MKFLVKSNAYINIPTHLADDPVGVLRDLPTFIQADASNPRVLELPDTIDINNISRRWEPLDDKAKAAQAKLAGPRPAAPAADDEITPAEIVDALLDMPADQRTALLAAAAAKEKAAKEAAAQADTMSGAIAAQAKAGKVKA